MSTVELVGRRWPIGGGGYSRLLPGALTRAAIRSLNRAGRAAVLYFHPYELDSCEMEALRGEGWTIPRRLAIAQSLFRGRTAPRLRRLLAEFRVSPIGDAIANV